MKSKIFINIFKSILLLEVLLGVLMTLDVFLFHTSTILSICGFCFTILFILLIPVMIKTRNEWRKEDEKHIEDIKEYLQTQYGNNIFCCKGEIQKHEFTSNSVFKNHYDYVSKLQVMGVLYGKKFIYHHIRVEDWHDNPDHDKIAKTTIFKGSHLRWKEEKLTPGMDIVICSANLYKLTGLRPDKKKYSSIMKNSNGIVIYSTKAISSEKREFKDILYIIRKIDYLKKSIGSPEMFIHIYGKTINVFIYENSINFQHRIKCIENMFRL